MQHASLGRGPGHHHHLVHWSSVGVHSKAASAGMSTPINKTLLASMHFKAALAALLFAAACCGLSAGAVFSIVHLLQQHPLHQTAILASIAAVIIASEAVFASVWLAKYRRLNSQPDLHRPRHPSFNPRHTYSKFVEEQHKTSKWICIKEMLSRWFGGVPIEDIYAGNVADLVTYGFWYMSPDEYEATYGQPASELVAELEQAWGLHFLPGHNPNIDFMAHLWQPIRCHYRPLVFYLCMEVVFLFCRTLMLSMGFKSGTVQGFTYYTYSTQTDDVNVAHMHKVPILFQHGVGAGLLPYSLFVARLAATGHPVAAMECNHLGMRWTQVKDADEVVDALTELLTDHLKWAKTCLSGHSYGTFYASRLLQLRPDLVDSACLIDPVTFNMFTGKLIKNFVYNLPNIITWFIARDIHHATSVCRNFFWSVLCLWPDQLPDRTLVVLSDGDELVPVKETLEMLRHEAPQALVLHHPNHRHADFISDLPWQDAVVISLVDLLDGRNSPSPQHTVITPATVDTHIPSINANTGPGVGPQEVEVRAVGAGRWLTLSWRPGVDCGRGGEQKVSAAGVPRAGSDDSGESVGEHLEYNRIGGGDDDVHAVQAEGRGAAVTVGTPRRKGASGRRKSGSAVKVDREGEGKGRGMSEGAKAAQQQQGKGRHGHSDSASSCELVRSRLRPMPHRMQQPIV